MSTSDGVVQAETPAESLRNAFQQTHNAVQWLARMVTSYSHGAAGKDIVVSWDESKSAFVTEEFGEGLQLELRLPDLTLQFLESGIPVKHQLNMEGRSPAHVEAWMLVELLHRGLDREQFSTKLPYTIANPMQGDDVEYSPELREAELTQILKWFAAATGLLKNLIKTAGGDPAATPGLVLLAKNFSLEVAIPLLGQSKASNRSMRVGFCPLRQGTVDPHYFVERSEPTKNGSNVVEIIKVSGATPTDIAGPAVAERSNEVVAKAQKRAGQ